ncbi:ly6/PLAUR domain-containing protein 2-like isoform X3 [Rana temporaria]|uniref:ly6/PLAUR domain-containing protein 2-like isoform X3 n=1 Tax=Rana temporaria TaxID=8407 RepID=UPI001AAC8BA9|nr:ly6/PLAUR domain-containing protein 2-like isoform X3 [Rana temporaria]
MAPHTSILLLAALCVGSAYSLQCYTCKVATRNSNINCETVTTCPSNYNYCQTNSATPVFGTTAMTKSCEISCMMSMAGGFMGSASVSCCSTDLCNTNGGISIRSSYSTIFLGTLVMLIRRSLL